jgi:hypothetical protein
VGGEAEYGPSGLGGVSWPSQRKMGRPSWRNVLDQLDEFLSLAREDSVAEVG